MGRYLMFKFIVFIAIFASSCNKHSGCYTINGTIDIEKNGDRIMLFKFRGDSIYSVDTTVISEGRFRFTGREALDDVAIVTTGNYPGIVRAVEVVLERGEIEVFMDSISRVQGTRLNDLYALYHKRNKQFRDSINSRDQHGNFKLDKVLIKEKHEAHDKYLVDFYKQNIENPVGRRAFKSYSNNLMGNDVYEIYALLPEQYKSDPEIVNTIRIRKELDKRNSARQALVGKKYSDFDLLTPDQTAKKLSDYIGKSEFVLLSFWGSFCGPCIDKMPELKDVYEKYHDKGFEIISISMDNSLGMWRGGINKVDVPWIHLSDLKGDKSPLKEAYHILGVPYEILLDKEGTIIQVHVNGAFLHEFLHKELD